MASRDEEPTGWHGDDGGERIGIAEPRPRANVGAAAARAALNITLILFLMVMMGLLVSAVAAKLWFQEELKDERERNTLAAVQVVQYRDDLACANLELARDPQVRINEASRGAVVEVGACGYEFPIPSPLPPSAGAPSPDLVIYPLPPKLPPLQLTIDRLLRSHAVARAANARPSAPLPRDSGLP